LNRWKRSLFIPQIQKKEAKRSTFIPQIQKIEVERTRLIPEIGKIEAKKTNWIEVKRREAVFLKLLRSPGIDSKEFIKHLQIQAQATLHSGIVSLESIPGLLKRLQIRAQATWATGIGSLESIPRLHDI
jgi:hypothetical protein